jgi:hypothetical protein
MKYLTGLFFAIISVIQSATAQNFSLDIPLNSRLRVATTEEIWGTDWHSFSAEARMFSEKSPWLGLMWSGWSDWRVLHLIIGSDRLMYEGPDNFEIISWAEVGASIESWPALEDKSFLPICALGVLFSSEHFSGNASITPSKGAVPWIAALRYREENTLAELAFTHEQGVEGWRFSISQFLPHFSCRMDVGGPYLFVSLAMAFTAGPSFELRQRYGNRGGSTLITALF